MSKERYRGGPKVRNRGRSIPEAKVLGGPPPGANSRMSPSGAGLNSATKRLPEASKARPRGLVRPVAKVLSMPSGVNTRMESFPGSPSVDTKRLPVLSRAKPTGTCVLGEGTWPGEDAARSIWSKFINS